MSTFVAHLTDIQQRLDALAEHHRVPGAVLAVSKGDEVLQLAMRVHLTGTLAELQGGSAPPPMALRPVDRESFYTVMNGDATLVTFLEFRRGRPGYLFAGRAARRSRSRAKRST
jgi:hypothetical protein